MTEAGQRAEPAAAVHSSKVMDLISRKTVIKDAMR